MMLNTSFLLQISELALQVAILFYGGHLVVTDQMTGGTLISFVIYELELGECLEVSHVMISSQMHVCYKRDLCQFLSYFLLPHRALRPSIRA